MKFLSKIKQLILPKEIDYFESLKQQSHSTAVIVNMLADFYLVNTSTDTKPFFDLISQAKLNRKSNLKELSNALVTPVDKEAISRSYVHMQWVVLSVEHLVVEMEAYEIYTLNEHDKILENLQLGMTALADGFSLLHEKKYSYILKNVSNVIHHDNLLIKEYSTALAKLFEGNDMKKIFVHREILAQLKEISKRIHVCANQLEDIVFKMN